MLSDSLSYSLRLISYADAVALSRFKVYVVEPTSTSNY